MMPACADAKILSLFSRGLLGHQVCEDKTNKSLPCYKNAVNGDGRQLLTASAATCEIIFKNFAKIVKKISTEIYIFVSNFGVLCLLCNECAGKAASDMTTKRMSSKKNHRAKTYFGMQFITATVSTALVLLLLGMVVFFVLVTRNLSDYMKESVNFSVVLNDDAKEADIVKLQREMEGMPFVKEVQYISKEQALKEQTEAMGTDPAEFIDFNPFYASMEVKLLSDYANTDSIAAIEQLFTASPLVQQVEYQRDLIETINENVGKVSVVLLALAAVLLFISFVLINNTIRLTIYAKRFLIHTMKLVGASRSFIRGPFMVRSFWQGVLAALVANALLCGGLYWGLTFEPQLLQVATLETLCIVGASVVVFGIVISMLCAYFSVNRYLGMNENELYYI